MQLTYDLKLTDVTNFYLHMNKQSEISNRRMRNRQLRLFLITLCISLILQWLYFQPTTPIYYLISLFIALLPVLFYSFYLERIIRRKFRKFHKNSREPNLFGTYRLSMGKGGLTEMIDGGYEVLYEWKDIKQIEMLKNYIYIYTNAIHAVIIPLRVFGTKDDCAFFLNELKRHIKESTKENVEVTYR
jgi:hypothetical protein